MILYPKAELNKKHDCKLYHERSFHKVLSLVNWYQLSRKHENVWRQKKCTKRIDVGANENMP